MDLGDIKGIGTARKAALQKAEIFSAEDLVNYFPYKYYDFSKTEGFSDDGKVRLILATANENVKVFRSKKITISSCKMEDEFGKSFTAVWFNQTYIKSIIFLGGKFFLYGKNSPTKKNCFVVKECKDVAKLDGIRFLPVYESIKSLGQKLLHDAINKVLETLNFPEFVPSKLLLKYNLIDKHSAYIELHNPTNESKLARAKETILVNKILPIMAKNEFNKNFFKVIKSKQYLDLPKLEEEFKSLLPFPLYKEQQKAIYEISNDLHLKFAMNRMLQGDVGSGKTVVAFFGAYAAAKSGFQAAIIAPTEILATQHYEFAKQIFKNTGICVMHLSISSNETLKPIATGEAQIVIGTHRLFQENVKFKNLGYLVIDEQHRFGVSQRAAMKAKGISPDTLVMSATPIPRTLFLTLNGDLELSVLNGSNLKKNVSTYLVSEKKLEDMWNYIHKKIAENSRVFVVCSKIDDENEDDSLVKLSANSMYKFLCEKYGKNLVGLIHGKLDKSSQNKIINRFRAGEIRVLVSTTIVEVGIDIREADIMVICTPERFGLATLHQLRGRIGRNGAEAHCFCLLNNIGESVFDRLNFFKNNTDGFKIAEYDLKHRGNGNIYGTAQHGFGDLSSTYGLGIKDLDMGAISVASQIFQEIKQNTAAFEALLEEGKRVETKTQLNRLVLN